jgi:ElaA protein
MVEAELGSGSRLATPPRRLAAVTAPTVHAGRFATLRTRTFHDMVRLRIDTFIVEQNCPYHELDGRDIVPSTEHVWIEEDGEVIAYLRMYPDDAGATWIGRVLTAKAHRGRGLGALLMRSALARATPPVRLSAQSQLAPWYAGLGFERCGPDFIEDGIPHTPMLLS